MFKKKQIFVLAAFVVSIAAFIIPFILNSTCNEKLRVSANLLSGICSCCTLLIAILLYNRYGIDKTIIDKKKEIVLDVLEKVKNLSIRIGYENGYLIYRPGTPYFEYFEEYYKMELVFNENYWTDLDIIFKYCNSLYTPKEILNKIREIEPSTMMYINETSGYGKVTLLSSKTEGKFGLINSRKLTFYELITMWNDLIAEGKNWLKNNSEGEIDLNIEE